MRYKPMMSGLGSDIMASEPPPDDLETAGDNNLVKSVINGVETYYIGQYYEKAVDGETTTVRKYYFADSTRIAMREDGTLYWLLSDHLGSTSITATASGEIFSELRYSAFGEIRFAVNKTPTDYLYTGQRVEEAGLYYYVARFYDPQIMHFVQADSIVSGAGNALSYNRYAYVNYSPVLKNDPSGNVPINGQYTGPDVNDQVTRDDLIGVISWAFGWKTKGEFSKRDLNAIIDAGNAIANFMTTETGKWGQGWIRTRLGNAVFRQDAVAKIAAKTIHAKAFVFPTRTILLQRGQWNKGTIVHELAHVLDNNYQTGSSGLPATFVGGGPADDMVAAMGGNPNLCVPRFRCISGYSEELSKEWYAKNVAGLDPWKSNNPNVPYDVYGNVGAAEDYAETFVWTILNPDLVPKGRLNWMKNHLASLH